MYFLRMLKCLYRFFVTIVSELFASGGLFSIFSHVSVQVAYIMYITQVMLGFINYMLVNNRKFNLMHGMLLMLYLITNKNQLNYNEIT